LAFIRLLFGSQVTLYQIVLLATVIIDANKPYTESSNTTGVSQNYFDMLPRQPLVCFDESPEQLVSETHQLIQASHGRTWKIACLLVYL
jgi:hypothetical protein